MDALVFPQCGGEFSMLRVEEGRLLAIGCVFAFGCTQLDPQFENLNDDEPFEEAITNHTADKADSYSETATYYRIRRDYRRCAAPDCGGYWLSLVNFGVTPCVLSDGSFTIARECYVADLDLGEIGLSSADIGDLREREVLVRGVYRVDDYGRKDAVTFVTHEAWQAATEARTQRRVYKVRDNGIRCITSPCFSAHEAKLNSWRHRDISGIDVSRVTTDDELLNEFYTALSTDHVIIAGRNRRVNMETGVGVTLRAYQFYLPIRAQVQTCGGFRGARCPEGEFCSYAPEAICGFADATGTCQPIPDRCEITDSSSVCGCDGRTYASACEANQAGVSVHYDRACDCVRGGCNGTGCFDPSDEPLATTCEWRDEYSCFDHGVCERQWNGQCGWTATEEMTQCIADHRSR